MKNLNQIKIFIKKFTESTVLNRSLTTIFVRKYRSIEINEQSIINEFKKNSNNTFLISFPRTGSHWLRMLMELYFGRPSLVRVFYYPVRKDYLCLHTHDLELDVERTNVIYLYRDPVDTIYSQLRYHKEDSNDRKKINIWADLYGRHLDKWLHQEKFTKQKSVVRYELLKTSPHSEFEKVCNHFGESLNTERFDSVLRRVSRKHVEDKTHHDRRVINLTNAYKEERQDFIAEQGEFVWMELLNGRGHLQQNF